jgi:tetratricopeptide (TPR) repeat protein
VLIGLVKLLALTPLPAQEPAQGDEVGQHITSLKRQAEDASLPIGQRETVVAGAAETLDRAARRAAGDEMQARWDQAIELLDGFNRQNPGHPRIFEFQLQAAVYRWAQGQSWRDAAELNPADARIKERAVAALDDSLDRLKAIPRANIEKALEDNIRYRQARSLADRAELDPAGSGTRQSREAEALEILKPPVSEPGLKGFAGLLRAELLRRAGQLDPALAELATASKADPPPPEREVYETLIPILLDQGRFAEAESTVKGSRLDQPVKDLELFEVALGRVKRIPAGDERLTQQRALFRQADALRKQKTQESRLALLELAASGIEPDERIEPLAWDVLGEAQELRGDVEKAGALLERAARRAEEQGQPESAAGYRLRGGGYLFQAGKYAEADALLSRVASDPRAGAVRSKAGMLRGLARGRALAAGAPGVTAASYADALQAQIRDFPGDPATDEARWLLGSLLRASHETARAVELWARISPGSPRWLDARLAVFADKLDRLEAELMISDRHLAIAEYRKIQEVLGADLKQASSDNEQVELGLAEVRLNLLPIVGRSRLALDDCNRLSTKAITPLQRYRLRLARMIALVHLGPPFLQAEREAQSHGSWVEPTAHAAFLEAVRLLDLCAALSDADLRQRRFGLVLRLLVQSAALDGDDSTWTEEQRSELKVRLARSCLFLGDERGARESLRGWTGPPKGASDEFLRDVADTYVRLEAYELAIDVQRIRSKNLTAGSPAWFEARYSLALAYFHAGQLKESAQLIDATAILHPDLGGGTVEKKFIKLRQRLGQRP